MKKTLKKIGCMIVLGMIAVSTVACSGKETTSNSSSKSAEYFSTTTPSREIPAKGNEEGIDSVDGRSESLTDNKNEDIIIESAKEIPIVREGNKPEAANTVLTDSTKVQLSINNIYQNPDLPQGCEVTSLAIVMNYKGYHVDKCTLSDNYLPKWPDLSGNPEYYYLKEPRNDGWYCFAGALCTTINNYSSDTGTSISYRNLTGTCVESLYNELENGNPVIVWGTLNWENPRMSGGLYTNLHCMVLSGYTDTSVSITDPIYGITTVDRNKFESVWHKMGNRALVVE